MQTGRKRVVIAMSGGVDSSVAAALLVQEGYEVIGMMMRLWSEPGSQIKFPVNRCCTPDQMADARRIANHLKIPFYVIDVQDHFRKQIVQYFIDEHLAGRTPNPCIECNRKIRFTYLLEHALALEADFLATGHYAQVRQFDGKYQLLQGADAGKDQSYVLYTLNQDKLAHVLFPVGRLHKSQVRELASQFGLTVASKQDSQDLCFLADGDYRRFLSDYSERAIEPGPIITEDGRQLGLHTGLPFYTIGQRKKLGVSSSRPLHVLRKENDSNSLVVGPRENLGQDFLFASHVNWISGTPPAPTTQLLTKIRYKARPILATVLDIGAGMLQVKFSEPVFGITPGQGVVFYKNNVCLGGGLIIENTSAQVEGHQMQQKVGWKP